MSSIKKESDRGEREKEIKKAAKVREKRKAKEGFSSLGG